MAPECRLEEEVLAALNEGRDAELLPARISEHLVGCESCANLAAMVLALREERRRLVAFAPVPEAGAVWRRVQRRAWSEAAAAAGRPITAVQVLAFAGAAGVAGACFGATSEWFQGVFGRAAAWLWAALPAAPAAAGTLAWPWVFLGLMLAAVFLLAPAVIIFVLVSEKS